MQEAVAGRDEVQALGLGDDRQLDLERCRAPVPSTSTDQACSGPFPAAWPLSSSRRPRKVAPVTPEGGTAPTRRRTGRIAVVASTAASTSATR